MDTKKKELKSLSVTVDELLDKIGSQRDEAQVPKESPLYQLYLLRVKYDKFIKSIPSDPARETSFNLEQVKEMRLALKELMEDESVGQWIDKGTLEHLESLKQELDSFMSQKTHNFTPLENIQYPNSFTEFISLVKLESALIDQLSVVDVGETKTSFLNVIGSISDYLDDGFKEFSETQKKYKDKLSELARLEKEIVKMRSPGNRLEHAKARLRARDKRYYEEKTNIINKRVEKFKESIPKREASTSNLEEEINRYKRQLETLVEENRVKVELETGHHEQKTTTKAAERASNVFKHLSKKGANAIQSRAADPQLERSKQKLAYLTRHQSELDEMEIHLNRYSGTVQTNRDKVVKMEQEISHLTIRENQLAKALQDYGVYTKDLVKVLYGDRKNIDPTNVSDLDLSHDLHIGLFAAYLANLDVSDADYVDIEALEKVGFFGNNGSHGQDSEGQHGNVNAVPASIKEIDVDKSGYKESIRWDSTFTIQKNLKVNLDRYLNEIKRPWWSVGAKPRRQSASTLLDKINGREISSDADLVKAVRVELTKINRKGLNGENSFLHALYVQTIKAHAEQLQKNEETLFDKGIELNKQMNQVEKKIEEKQSILEKLKPEEPRVDEKAVSDAKSEMESAEQTEQTMYRNNPIELVKAEDQVYSTSLVNPQKALEESSEEGTIPRLERLYGLRENELNALDRLYKEQGKKLRKKKVELEGKIKKTERLLSSVEKYIQDFVDKKATKSKHGQRAGVKRSESNLDAQVKADFSAKDGRGAPDYVRRAFNLGETIKAVKANKTFEDVKALEDVEALEKEKNQKVEQGGQRPMKWGQQ